MKNCNQDKTRKNKNHGSKKIMLMKIKLIYIKIKKKTHKLRQNIKTKINFRIK